MNELTEDLKSALAMKRLNEENQRLKADLDSYKQKEARQQLQEDIKRFKCMSYADRSELYRRDPKRYKELLEESYN